AYGQLSSLQMLAAFAGDAFAAGLKKAARAKPFTPGLPLRDRLKKLRELDRAIADNTRSHTEIVDGAAELGIKIALLPHVERERRATVIREGNQKESHALHGRINAAGIRRAEAADAAREEAKRLAEQHARVQAEADAREAANKEAQA